MNIQIAIQKAKISFISKTFDMSDSELIANLQFSKNANPSNGSLLFFAFL